MTKQEKQFNILLELKKQELNNRFQEEVSSLITNYTQAEIQSWTLQLQEANNYPNISNPPFLTSLAINRNIPLDTLVQAVLNKAQSYSDLVSIALGKKQAKEDLLDKISNNPTTDFETKILELEGV